MIFGGKFRESGRQGYAFAVAEGFRGFGPAVYGELMSYGRDPWVFQGSIATALGCSVRTVQRWLAAFRELGLLECWRGKKGETPPGASGPIKCGWSHRSLTAWHHAGEAFRRAVAAKAAKRAERLEARRNGPARFQGMTAEEIDAFAALGSVEAIIASKAYRDRQRGRPPPE
jgi:Homeodomain-like domain